MSKDVRFHETNPFYSKNLEVNTQGENYLDMFPLLTTNVLITENSNSSFILSTQGTLPSSEQINKGLSLSNPADEVCENLLNVISEAMEHESTPVAP